ncbi:MAG: tetratricopeptide repeat protein [Pseudomonadota bacterium]
MRSLLFSAILFLGGTAFAQEEDAVRSLADMKLEISFLSAQMDGLRTELLQSNAALSQTNTGDALNRVALIEQELRTLTGQLEELEHRIDQTIKQTEAKIGQLNARLSDLEGAPAESQVASTSNTDDIPLGLELTVSEKEDFESAKSMLDANDFNGAAAAFGAFVETYPGGPLTAFAHLYRGQAFSGEENWKQAGVSYLASFSAAPKKAPGDEALFGLAESLSKLGKSAQACASLSELPARFEQSRFVAKAAELSEQLACE